MIKLIKNNLIVCFLILILSCFILISFTGCIEADTGRGNFDERRQNSFSQSELEYFYEIALGAEYGESGNVIHKWADDIGIKLKGRPTDRDIETINEVISELNYIIYGIKLDIVVWDPDIEIYFDSVDRFSSIEPNYIQGNTGFFWTWWDDSGALYRARILIATGGINQKERSHLIREELTQSLGMMNDSYEYKDSIFYQDWTDTGSYSDMDRAVIRILYDPRIKLGMTMDEVDDVIAN